MKAIVCSDFGAIDALRYRDVAEPTAGPGEVLVDIKAGGVNFPDGLLVQGLYQHKPALPFVPGMEFCGEIAALGDGVSGLATGQRVIAMSADYGGFAERAAVAAERVVPVPLPRSALSDRDAANLLCAHGTAQHALVQRARLAAGETLLVLGAAGGTGLAAVQIGKTLGARVIAACSSAAKLELAGAAGADELINYAGDDLRETVKERTGGRGVDVVYDPVGGDLFDVCARLLARGGRLLVVGFSSGRIATLPANLPLVKEYSLVGVFWGSFIRHEPQTFAANMRQLFDWVNDGKVWLETDQVLPLSRAVEALNRVMNRQVRGKMVVVPDALLR